MALVLEVIAKTKQGEKAIKKLATNGAISVKKLEKASVTSSKRMTKGFTDFQRVLGGLGVGLGFAAVIKGFNKVVQSASDTEESLNKVREVFGEAAISVEKFAETSAESLGASEQAALAMTGEIGNLLVAMKFAEEDAADFSTEMVQLAADLGSFNNVPTADALNAIRAALVGETEPIRRFGSDIRQARLDSIALGLGLEFTKGKMDAQTKALAVMKGITEDTRKAQGDFRRTSDGLANSQKILAANFADLQAALGQKLIPTMKTVVSFVNEMITSFTKTDFDKAIDKLKELGDSGDFVETLKLNRLVREEAEKRNELSQKILGFQTEQNIVMNQQTGEIIKAGTALQDELTTIVRIAKFTRDTTELQKLLDSIELKRLDNQKKILSGLEQELDKTTSVLDDFRGTELALLGISTQAAEFLSLLNEEKTITEAIRSLLNEKSEQNTNITTSEEKQLELLKERAKGIAFNLATQKTIATLLMDGVVVEKERVNTSAKIVEQQEKSVELQKIGSEESQAWLNTQIILLSTAEQFALSLQSSLTFFQGMDKFAKSLLRSVNNIASQLAGKAFSSLLLSLIPGGGGFFNIFRGLVGFQGGGSFRVPGPSTGTDSSIVAFKAKPGEDVNISNPTSVTNNNVSNGPVNLSFNFQVADEITIKTKVIPIINDFVTRQGGKLMASGLA